ncbi:MAG: hypothetical protein U9P00_08225 [Pseudomonadota bacterium]|nr:hypothetical protein [Pseudomonadota bacterium]
MFKTYTTQKKAWGNNRGARWRFSLVAAAVSLLLALPVAAGSREQAKRIHDRLTGVPPTVDVLDAMTAKVSAGGNGPFEAALIAMDTDPVNGNPENAKYFYNVTLKNFAAPWTNEAQSVFEPLNDYTATVIGMIRDDVPFNKLFSVDYVYGAPTLNSVSSISPDSNAHYEDLEAQAVDLSDKTVFEQVDQVTAVGLPDSSAAAGVLTSRAAARAFFIDGTNRAMFRFTMLNHLCNDMEQVKDTTRAPDRIRQDVSRSPGGDSRIFLNSCVGCHTGMDPMAQAFAYYEYVYPEGDEDGGRLVYTTGQVQPKYLINEDNFKPGYVTPDDRWDNYWRSGPNAILGWDPVLTGTGYGARSMGEELANSEAFARCQSIKVYRTVCLGEPTQGQLNTLKTTFQAGYNMKNVFAEAAVQCMGF